MLDEVLGNYLDSLSEREFDAPFMAVLRAHGFFDIHFLHGPFEFGKDFIAKRVEDSEVFQYAFQTKSGDLDLADYRVIRGQIDDLRRNAVGHPNYDAAAKRRAVLVTTGRLIGAAGSTAQADQADLRSRGEGDFIIWDRERLIELMLGVPETGYPQGSSGAFLRLLGAIDERDVTESDLEQYARRWILPIGDLVGLRRAALETGILANRLRRTERLDLAAVVALCLIRGAWASSGQTIPPEEDAELAADAGRGLFNAYTEAVWARCADTSLDPFGFLRQQRHSLIYLTYPVSCMRLVELLGLYALMPGHGTDCGPVREFLAAFVEHHPGASHPISDRWASSVTPAVLAIIASNRAAAEGHLARLASWTCDQYERGQVGLAGPRATPEEETFVYFSGGLRAKGRSRRNTSYLLALLTDLAAICGFEDLYELIVNDIQYVQAFPELVEAADNIAQYQVDGETLIRTSVSYPAKWSATDGWKVALHHLRAPSTYYLNRIGRSWDHLAISSVVRDRHFLSTMADLAQAPVS